MPMRADSRSAIEGSAGAVGIDQGDAEVPPDFVHGAAFNSVCRAWLEWNHNAGDG